MSGPGQYVADPTEGITKPEDLPPATIIRRSCNFQRRPCPHCGKSCFRHGVVTRILHDVGDLVSARPRDIHLVYSRHRCTVCRKIFNANTSDYALSKAHYTHRVVSLAVRLVVEDGLPYQAASWHLWRDHRVFVPFATIQNWVEAGGKRRPAKCGRPTSTGAWLTSLDTSRPTSCTMVRFASCRSLTIALSSGSFIRCSTTIPITQRSRPSSTASAWRCGCAAWCCTASPPTPRPCIQSLCARYSATSPTRSCEFHIIKELTKAILRAVAKVRKKLAADKPVGKRGRPTTTAAKRIARRRQRLQHKVADLFEYRHLFVQHDLTPAERRTLQRVTRGLPQLRTLRDLMEEVYRLFDRRCRTDTALAKLAKLRQRVRRFKQVGKILNKLRSPNLEKALTFLDDKLLPSTSNAVERGNRRHRKMQKTVYRVRTRDHIHNRIALDMLRDSQSDGRTTTLTTLHCKRAS